MIYFLLLCAMLGVITMETLGIYVAIGFEDGLKKTFEKIKQMPRFIKASIITMPIGAIAGLYVGYVFWNIILALKNAQY